MTRNKDIGITLVFDTVFPVTGFILGVLFWWVLWGTIAMNYNIFDWFMILRGIWVITGIFIGVLGASLMVQYKEQLEKTWEGEDNA